MAPVRGYHCVTPMWRKECGLRNEEGRGAREGDNARGLQEGSEAKEKASGSTGLSPTAPTKYREHLVKQTNTKETVRQKRLNNRIMWRGGGMR